jgi:hypothetical protein
VVKSLGENLENTFCGEISRLELRNLMTRPELFIMKSDFSATVRMPHVSDIMHPHFRLSQKSPHLATDELLQQYMNEPLYCEYYVNLSPYINDSGRGKEAFYKIFNSQSINIKSTSFPASTIQVWIKLP